MARQLTEIQREHTFPTRQATSSYSLSDRDSTTGPPGPKRPEMVFSSESLSSAGGLTTQDVDYLAAQVRAEQRHLVQSTWERALESTNGKAPIAAISNALYTKLFELLPETRLLFHTDQQHRGSALAGTLSLVFKCLSEEKPQGMDKKLQQMAIFHVNMGVTPHMFDCFGQALIFAVREQLQGEWDDVTEHAWQAAYKAVSTLLLNMMDRIKFRSKNIPQWMSRRLSGSRPLLKESWQRIKGEPKFMEIFYKRFFDHCPEAKLLFRGSLSTQGQVLHGAIGELTKFMDKPERLDKQIKDLGRMHAKMAVTPTMFHEFQLAMLWAMKHVLGDELTPELESIWSQALSLLVRGMIGSLDNKTFGQRISRMFSSGGQ